LAYFAISTLHRLSICLGRFLLDRAFAFICSSFGSGWILPVQISAMSRTQHPIDLMEEAIHLLRRAPIETYALFLVGITPFVLCLFNFCSEMSYSDLAGSNLPTFSSALALFYLWMKAFQSLACRQLVAVYSGELPTTGKFGLRACLYQAAIHPVGLLAKPMAALASIPGFLTFVPPLMLPALVTFSFFQNASILITGERGDFEKCWQLSVHRVRVSASLLLLSTFLRIIIFLNVFVTIGILPYLLKALFGIDTFLSRDYHWLISFAYFVGIGLISYFVVDLLIKAIHVIRVCRADVQTTGKDLQRSLRTLTAAKSMSLFFCYLLFAICYLTPPAAARLSNGDSFGHEILLASVKRASPPSQSDPIPDAELNQQIDRELNSSEYNWRKPLHHLTPAKTNWVQDLGAWITKTFLKINRGIGRVAEAIAKWWRSLFPNSGGSTPFSAQVSAPIWISQLLLLATICGLVIVAALIVLRILGRSRKVKPISATPQISVIPNLESESIVADELPEDQWLVLARRKLEEGEPRLALRALFLAVLALLGAQRLIIVRRSKSNSDYETELRRRRSAELAELFGGNRRLFERCWYGDHPVTDIEIEQSNSFYQRLRHACLVEK
jgi:hypothetical protein